MDTARNYAFNLRFQHAHRSARETPRVKQAKKVLARALTIAVEDGRGLDVEAEIRRQKNE